MNKPRVLILDTYYPEFLRNWETGKLQDFLKTFGSKGPKYQDILQAVLDRLFGTADFYSRNLNLHGWNAVDVIANYHNLQAMWAEENIDGWHLNPDDRFPAAYIATRQIQKHDPQVVFLQDLSFFSVKDLQWFKQDGRLLAAQLSCPMPREELVREMDVIFTSFPHYVDKLKAIGVPKVVFSKLAFEPTALSRAKKELPKNPERSIDVCFVGGVGKLVHWLRGTEILETVSAIYGDRFKWFGYGKQWIEEESPLMNCYQGPAWGIDMYKLYLQSKIVINRHGEVAEGYSNNMRMFEATGCGAMLMTEKSKNLNDFFLLGEAVGYSDAGSNDIIQGLNYYLTHQNEMRQVAAFGQRRTLNDHTYYNKMGQISEVLKEMLHECV